MLLAADASQKERQFPRLAAGRNPTELTLSPAEGFLLSRIDGLTSWTALRAIGGLPPDEVEACLTRWLSQGIVELPREPGPAPTRGEAPAGDARDARILPELGIPEELQREILAFEGRLESPYHELLGVAPDADARAIKRAYFALSKRYHPDRYYRRELGPFGARLERIFKKLVEAYELLSDPATRAEVERSLSQMPPPAEGGPEAAPEKPLSPGERKLAHKRKLLERLRRQFRIPDEILAERRYKAQQFYELGTVAARKERWKEAAASLRLAIAFDPWAREYKENFAQVQAQVHQVRAAELLEKADASWDGSALAEALRLYEEALLYRPGDALANERAAAVALQLGELDRAQEYAENACQLAPENGAFHYTWGRTLLRAGLREKAREVLETAVRLDPAHGEARAELDALRRGRRRR